MKRIEALPAIAVVVFLMLLSGCGAGGLKLTPVKATQQKPSNVAVYFKVQEYNGNPVGGLTADQFRIYEDGGLVSENESKQTILNPQVAASYYTLLLVDMSGSVSGDPEAVKTLVDAAQAFTDRVEKSQKVGVFAFDGSEDIHPIAPFTQGAGSAKGAISGLQSYKPQDPSTNLHGAMVNGIKELDKALSHAEHPMRFGTLVVFSDGADRAGRVTKDDMRKAIRDTKYEIFAIGLGKELQESDLKDIGKDGTARADDKQAVVKAFDEIATRIENSTKAYYLLSYCSPARAGKHEVKIEAVYKDENGKAERTGSMRSEFDATGFQPGCDPNTPPNFDLSKGDALAPADDDDKDKEKDHDKDHDKGHDHDHDKGDKKDENKKGDKKDDDTKKGGSHAASKKPVQLPPPPPPSGQQQQPAPPAQQQPQDFNP